MSDPNNYGMVPNTFMGYIAKAVKPGFSLKRLIQYWSWKRSYNKFKKMILQSAPSFGFLLQFAEFIKLAEFIFYFDNNKNGKIYSSTGYQPGENGFKITIENKAEIVVKLFIDDETIMIDIRRLKGTNLKNSYTFQAGQWMYSPDSYDIIHLDIIETIINQSIIELMDWCIEAKFKYSIN